MRGINVGRWIGGGVAAGILLWIIESAASGLYMVEMQATLAAHGLSMQMDVGFWLTSIAVSQIVGITLVFFYVAVRPRFGPGPRTAVIVAVAMWIGGYLLALVGYQMLGLFPGRMLVLWGGVGLTEMVLASLLGGWIYREV